ncbi:MAG: hypothetical protein SGJ27_10125 [Candidatus Melainabacteria bacterium]|nr:hypothetical protein [Candidatus Melainabacteria bacterium]
MPTVYIGKNAVNFHASGLIGEGGEAEIYQLNASTVMKLFKQASHPQYQLKGAAAQAMQAAARARIVEIQRKLPAFPRGLAPHVVEPDRLVYDTANSKQQIVGYTMPLITPGHSLREYAQRAFRESSGIGLETVIELFAELHKTLICLHQHDVIIGDFNQFNVLVSGKTPYLIDADSMQYGGFPCKTFSPRYADPLILRSNSGEVSMVHNHSKQTDWYAFAVLLFECLLFVHPYGGVYKTTNPNKRVSPEERSLHRISVLDPDVRYPNSALPLSSLPHAVQHFYEQVLTHDFRDIFPLQLLLSLHPANQSALTVRPNNVIHINKKRPNGATVASTAGGAKVRNVFSTSGVVLKVAFDGSSLRYLYHEDGKFIREDGRVIFRGGLDPTLKFALSGSSTLCGKGTRSFVFGEDDVITPLQAELYRRQEPIFDANAENFFYVQNGQLFRHSITRPVLVDDVLPEQTRIWMGSEFGFAFYLAGEFRRAFLFDKLESGRTLIEIDAVSGKLLDVHCKFSPNYLWVIASVEQNGQIFNRVTTLDKLGRCHGIVEAIEGSGTWMDDIASSCAASFPLQSGGTREALLVATADGVVQIESIKGILVETKVYSNTKQHVQPGERLLFTASGLYAWDANSIRLITTD